MDSREDDPGEALDDVEQIHPALDRLRQLVASATLFDLKATAGGYWTERPGQDDPANPSERRGRSRNSKDSPPDPGR